MADDPKDPPADPPKDPAAEGEGRLDRIEDKVDKLASLVAKVIPGSRKEAGEREEAKLDRPSTVEEQVQAELDRRDKAAAAKAKDDKDTADKETTAQRLARLEEKPPEPPIRRATRMLGWGGGR